MLQFSNVSFCYSSPLLKCLSFHLNAGQSLVVEGPNGAGKTTLLQLAAGLLTPTEGVVERKVALDYLPSEAFGFYQDVSAMRNLEFYLLSASAAYSTEALHQLLDRVGLEGPFIQTHLKVSEFSTGMKKRLALARMLLVDAAVWLLDEPFNGLDQGGRTLVLEILKSKLTKQGAFILVDHAQHLPADMTHQKVVL